MDALCSQRLLRRRRHEARRPRRHRRDRPQSEQLRVEPTVSLNVSLFATLFLFFLTAHFSDWLMLWLSRWCATSSFSLHSPLPPPLPLYRTYSFYHLHRTPFTLPLRPAPSFVPITDHYFSLCTLSRAPAPPSRAPASCFLLPRSTFLPFHLLCALLAPSLRPCFPFPSHIYTRFPYLSPSTCSVFAWLLHFCLLRLSQNHDANTLAAPNGSAPAKPRRTPRAYASTASGWEDLPALNGWVARVGRGIWMRGKRAPSKTRAIFFDSTHTIY
ncbi:hypothetical protein B0H16DRAFT_794925 [Mycena metata]|uniref:Uncharacterized protein n=1 Tax=Mycena metata TaxID=1033252 RepID=A0AAD7NB49_9AGAR|nr:hypothetical protein B0H16DRAFT_794925 [Mycena metata]